MKILDRLRLLSETRTIRFRQHQAVFHRNALIVWISIGLSRERDSQRISPPFPAMLDTGNNCEAYLHENHLVHWAGMSRGVLPVFGSKSINQRRIPFHSADIWIHPNMPGSCDRLPEGKPFRLELEEGLAVRPAQADEPVFPRVPLIGLTALYNNNLDYWFDSKYGHSYLRTASWRSRIIRSLCRFF